MIIFLLFISQDVSKEYFDMWIFVAVFVFVCIVIIVIVIKVSAENCIWWGIIIPSVMESHIDFSFSVVPHFRPYLNPELKILEENENIQL